MVWIPEHLPLCVSIYHRETDRVFYIKPSKHHRNARDFSTSAKSHNGNIPLTEHAVVVDDTTEISSSFKTSICQYITMSLNLIRLQMYRNLFSSMGRSNSVHEKHKVNKHCMLKHVLPYTELTGLPMLTPRWRVVSWTSLTGDSIVIDHTMEISSSFRTGLNHYVTKPKQNADIPKLAL